MAKAKTSNKKRQAEALRRRIQIAIGVLVLLAVGSGVRALMILGYPQGERQSVTSPNELATVFVGKMVDKPFLGGTVEFYEIEVIREFPESGHKQRVFYDRYMVNEIGGSADLSDIDEIVEWAPQSQYVIVTLGIIPVRVQVPI